MPIILSALVLSLIASSALSAEFTYQDYAKASEMWRRGYVFGIARYMAAVAQPDEEPPYPVRTAFQRCLNGSTDSVLLRHVDAYVKANAASSHGPMTGVVMRALFDLCRVEILKVAPADSSPRRR
jgi:hypothetical protein